MKTKWIDKSFAYDGSQLRSLFAYLEYEILGDSIVSWQGPCDIPADKIVDGEDLLLNEKICGSDMLHFIVEMHDGKLFSAVALQRLLASIMIDNIREMKPNESIGQGLRRTGDDIYFNDKKFNISIATVSPSSALIHFAVNVSNEGTPVATLSLSELEIAPKILAEKIMIDFSKEYDSIKKATQKVKWVK